MNPIVLLTRPQPGKMSISLVTRLAKVLDGLPVHRVARCDCTKPSMVVD
jgi:hypothetical protein